MPASIPQENQKIETMFIEADKQWATQALFSHLNDKTTRGLSPANQKYLKGLLLGYDQAEIAKKVCVCESTVKAAIAQITAVLKEFLGWESKKRLATKEIPELLCQYRCVRINIQNIFTFYGRERELDDLTRWVKTEKCQFILIKGRGGIGKTYLASKWVTTESIEKKFSFFIRLEMGEQRTFDQVIWDIIQYLPGYERDDMPSGNHNQITWLITALNKYQCLIILDDIHEVFYGEDGKPPSNLELCQACEKLCRRLATELHKSCIVAIGWDKPLGFERIEQPESTSPSLNLQIRLLCLKGLDFNFAQYILRDYALQRDMESWRQLVEIYRGSPYALKLVSNYISKKFTYNKIVSAFLADDTVHLGKSATLICKQFDLLTKTEKKVLLIICKYQYIRRISDLFKYLDEHEVVHSTTDIGEAIATLHDRGLIEVNEKYLNAPPTITKYALKTYHDIL